MGIQMVRNQPATRPAVKTKEAATGRLRNQYGFPF
jgi:hypothetical protein